MSKAVPMQAAILRASEPGLDNQRCITAPNRQLVRGLKA